MVYFGTPKPPFSAQKQAITVYIWLMGGNLVKNPTWQRGKQ